MKVLLTGSAGFIASFIARRLLERGDEVVGLDNVNGYYDTALKYGRLKEAGIREEEVDWYKLTPSHTYERYRFIRMNLEDRQAMRMLFANEGFDAVVNLAAQAGVRYSITNPYAYVESNLDGFINVLEGCRYHQVSHLVYASSSSVYGLNADVPFSEKTSIAHPVSLYAASKKSNELMAHAYSQLYGVPATGLRFFTVYGPWGRPDMSPFLFTDAILHDRPIQLFNNGDMLRDFTYIDDIAEAIIRLQDIIPQSDPNWTVETGSPATSSEPYRVYNIGNSSPVELMDYITALEDALGKQAEKNMLPLQPGDVLETSADTKALYDVIGFKPQTSVKDGVKNFVDWYRKFYNV